MVSVADAQDAPATPPAAAEPPPGRWATVAWWLAALVLAASLSVVATWPLALHMGQLWSVRLPGPQHGSLAAPPTGSFPGNDALQTMHVNQVVIDNVVHLREPYLDLASGVAGPEPLRTSSLDLPWTLLEGLLLPLVGLVAAYNTVLLLSTVATVLCAFGLLRRHTRLPLLALAGALAYAFVPGRVFQLSLHFNAVLWAAFPAAAWALEAMLERHRAEARWLLPGLWLALVTVIVALSGEYHHSLYLSGMLGFLVVWWLAAAALRREPLPLGPAALTLGAVIVGDAYVLATFRWVFGDSVAGTNGQYAEAVRYAPQGLGALVHKRLGELGEGLVYLGWPVTLLALAGAVLALVPARRQRGAAAGPAGPQAKGAARPRAVPGEAAYAVLAVPVLFLTFGPAADQALQRALARLGLPHQVEPYRLVFDLIPFLKLQRVTARLLVLAALLLILLAVVALDAAAWWLARLHLPARLARLARLGWPVVSARVVAAAGTAALVLATTLLLQDYRVFRSVLRPAETGNQVVAALKAAGDQDGPFLGLPIYGPTYPWNAASTYLASQTGRRTLNAYNQSPSSWLESRADALAPLTWGQVDDATLALLRSTGTHQVVVMDEPHVYCCGTTWNEVVSALLASGHFRLVVQDPPFALLELVPSTPTRG